MHERRRASIEPTPTPQSLRQTRPFFSIVLEPPVDTETLIISILIGAAGGLLGGLFGIGGGIIIIPLLTMAQGSNPHLYQAASLVAAIAVSLGSIPRHIRARAIRWHFAWKTIPISLVAVAIGVWISNSITDPQLLERIFAAFLLYVAAAELLQRMRANKEEGPPGKSTVTPLEHTGWKPAAIVGSLMGSLAGMLGVGGGVIAVPLMRVVNGFSLRVTIATSAFLVLPTVVAGALMKYSTLSLVHSPAGDPLTMTQALWLAAALAPGAFFGAMFGASLVHRLPQKQLAVAFAILCVLLSIRMAGIGG